MYSSIILIISNKIFTHQKLFLSMPVLQKDLEKKLKDTLDPIFLVNILNFFLE
jgi:hypothetical protein